MATIRITGRVDTSADASVASSAAAPTAVHHLPCKISHDGAARVDTYFLPTQLDDGKLEAAFRGRRLEGTVVDLAAVGAVGVVLRESSAPTEAEFLPVPANAASSQAAGSAASAASGEASAAGASGMAGARPAAGAGRFGAAARAGGYGKPAAGGYGRGGGRGYGGGGGGGFGGGAIIDEEDEDEDEDGDGDDDDDEDDLGGYALDMGQDEDDEVNGTGAGSAGALSSSAAQAAGGSSASAAHDSGGTGGEFGRCWMRTFDVERASSKATYWLHDAAPSEFDGLRIAADAFATARQLHGAVGADELAEVAAFAR